MSTASLQIARAESESCDAQKYLTAFSGSIPPVETSSSYRTGLIVVAIAMILLPLLYLLMVVGIGYGVWYHAVHNHWLLETAGKFSRRSTMGGLLIYTVPIVAGIGLVIFLVKPFFAWPAKQVLPRPLDPAEEPLLFAFVERICRAIGAPSPKHIYVTCDVNAAAGFRRGIWSMLGNDLALTIGLPLVAGLNSRQFAGVLAHEFGHFSQGAGMRMSYIIRGINTWFAGRVYDRDGLDQLLYEWSYADYRLSLWVVLIQGAIWCTRKILWCFMMAGHLISCYMLRQMEFDADLYAAYLAGSENFAEANSRIRLLAFAADGAREDLGQSWNEKQLADDLPLLILANVEQIPPAIAAKFLAASESAPTGRLDTHPSDGERIARARAAGAPGIFVLDAPAVDLFSNFARLSREFTKSYYHELLGPAVQEENLVGTLELVSRSKAAREEVKVSQRYLQCDLSAFRPLFLDAGSFEPAQDVEGSRAVLLQTRQQMQDNASRLKHVWKEHHAADGQFIHGLRATTLLQSNIKITAAQFDLPFPTISHAELKQKNASQQIDQLLPELLAFERDARIRFRLALSLLLVPQVQSQWEEGESLAKESRQLVASLAALEQGMAVGLELRWSLTSLTALTEHLGAQQSNQKFIDRIREQMREVQGNLSELQRRLGSEPYPFAHAGEPMTVASYAIPMVPHSEDLEGLLCGWDVMARLLMLYFRIVGRLSAISEKVESAIGLPPLPDYEPLPEPESA